MLTALPRPFRFATRRRPAALALCAVALAAVPGLACDPPAPITSREKDPLASLASSVQSEVFDLAFWVQEQSARTDTWRRARAYCQLHAELPNCRTVHIATWWATPPPPPPKVQQVSPVPAPVEPSAPAPERNRP
jgi:hypothetical protein